MTEIACGLCGAVVEERMTWGGSVFVDADGQRHDCERTPLPADLGGKASNASGYDHVQAARDETQWAEGAEPDPYR